MLESGLPGTCTQGSGPDRSTGAGADGKGRRTPGVKGTPELMHLGMSSGLDKKWVLSEGEVFLLNE